MRACRFGKESGVDVLEGTKLEQYSKKLGFGLYVKSCVKGINAHGEGGEEERWREGIEAGDGGRRTPFRNLHAS